MEEEKQKKEKEEGKEEKEEKYTEEEDDDFEFLSRSLIDGDGHAAFCLELKRIRSKLTQFFDLESLRVKVQEADKLHHQNRFLFRRMLVTSSIARTIAAVYCVCVARTLMHCKLLLLRREHNLTQTSLSSFLGLDQDSNHFLSIRWADSICQVVQEGVETAFKGLSDERLLKSSMDVQEVVGKVKQSILVAAERKGWGTGLIRTPSPLERELGGGWLGRLLLADNRWRMKEGERGAGVCDLECWIVEEQVEQLNSNLALMIGGHGFDSSASGAIDVGLDLLTKQISTRLSAGHPARDMKGEEATPSRSSDSVPSTPQGHFSLPPSNSSSSLAHPITKIVPVISNQFLAILCTHFSRNIRNAMYKIEI
ncbi:hypothetical protein GUITHDRAFT_137414 [Guillardia theta CCMP2712]|uniref:Uncharacterized protein n=1 Tax=Guillardia theta (strain CCMP2712) TaxID=905079 RepID=L1JHT3_GUITC|nr:hypothetical protein GUITHDRAFT_137414 [Guillardia theta CCMP2712]EKX47655.1 hypothetical protein GUITHDRAFT_137414 [Guillardia theta CCMP2712]|eukprot:XP_005834635.1 hypothetical protein GUITHDRAFT_137414 [Guillardia theta CCMP2712]